MMRFIPRMKAFIHGMKRIPARKVTGKRRDLACLPSPLGALGHPEGSLGPELARLRAAVARPVRLAGRLDPRERVDERVVRARRRGAPERATLGVAPLLVLGGAVAVAARVDDEMLAAGRG